MCVVLDYFLYLIFYDFYLFFFFFFKQKTAYEMRISDWSSDVCSSDLLPHHFRLSSGRQFGSSAVKWRRLGISFDTLVSISGRIKCHYLSLQIGRASCRERVCQYV